MKTKRLNLITDPKMPFGFVEAYKLLRTNLKFVISDENEADADQGNVIRMRRNGKCFVITSAVPEEGKSTVSINLAATLAADNRRVILVEGDMRRPALAQMLGMGRNGSKKEKAGKEENNSKEGNFEAEEGLSSLLSGSGSSADVIRHVDDLNIDVLPCGIIPPNPSELLGRDKMKQVIEALRNSYDYVIIDAPPSSMLTDAAVIGEHSDGAIMVIRSNYASAESVLSAQRNLEKAHVKVLGAIVTCHKDRKVGKHSYYYYYKRHGYTSQKKKRESKIA